MDSVDYLEVQAGANRVFWSNVENWNAVKLVHRDGIWEVHVGRDIFSNPDRINMKGRRRNISTVSIWCAINNNPDFKADLLSALSFRDVRVEWKDITQPGMLLSSTASGNLPDIILLNQSDLLRLNNLTTSSRPIARLSSRWFKTSSSSAEIFPLAVDAYQAEASLLYLLAENPGLFDEKGRLPTGLIGLFDWASAARNSRLIVTGTPLAALASGNAAAAVLLPTSTGQSAAEGGQIQPADPPEGTVNIARLQFAAIPAALSHAEAETAALIMNDAARFGFLGKKSAAVDIPMDPRILRFFDAYERIGRLAVSGQLESAEAVDLINSYINEGESSE